MSKIPPYTLIRSKRKSIAIYVKDGAMEVRAPLTEPRSRINAFIKEKEAWITENIKKTAAKKKRREAFTLGYGDYVTYRGREYPIIERVGNNIGFDGKCFFMPPYLPPEEIKDVCVQIYRRSAKQVLTQKVYFYADILGISPKYVKINSARTRWGSCSAKGGINFSWRLIMADDDVIDYVVIHELAHFIEMNHSPQFWDIVRRIVPDYTEKKEKLGELQSKLSAEDWE